MSTKKRKVCKPCECKTKACKSKRNQQDFFDGFMSDLTAHKLPVLVLMVSALALGALFSMMLGVSAAQF